MIDYTHLINQLCSDSSPPKIQTWGKKLPEQINQGLSESRHGDLKNWLKSFKSLPNIKTREVDLKNGVKIGKESELNKSELENITQAFKALIPWRKGPYTLFDSLHIDSEWRSDFKWDRLKKYISPLNNRKVLDVGCGNGYHCLRMFGEGASQVIGIDPSPRFIVQFYMLKHFINDCKNTLPVEVLPIGIEHLPSAMEYFDTTFSMGVLYHRKSPLDHLLELKSTLKPGGELVLETLIIDGELGDSLVPEQRYAMMRNVWFLPSTKTLMSWLRKCGFTNVRCVDINQTSTEEQRSTQWMKFQSLSDFLNPSNAQLTAENHPAPKRGIFIANKPE